MQIAPIKIKIVNEGETTSFTKEMNEELEEMAKNYIVVKDIKFAFTPQGDKVGMIIY